MTIALKNITFNYPKYSKLFNDLNIECKAGEVTTIIGKSGCGKSTLLSIFNGLIKPNSGIVKIDNKIHATIFQNKRLIPWITIGENIVFGAKSLGLKTTKQDIEDALLDLGLSTKIKDAYPKILSGGMEQRVAVARALICNPDILFMDEPFSALDNMLKNDLMYRITNYIKKNNAYCLFITHDIYEAGLISDKIYKMIRKPAKLQEIITLKEPFLIRDETMLNNIVAKIKIKVRNENSANFSKYAYCDNETVVEDFALYMESNDWQVYRFKSSINSLPTLQPDLIIINPKHKLIDKLIAEYKQKTTRFLFVKNDYIELQGQSTKANTRKKLINWWGWDNIYYDLVKNVPAIKVKNITIGHNWCFVTTEKSGGLARTPSRGTEGGRSVNNAGKLHKYNLKELAQLAYQKDDLARCIGIAAINCYYNSICNGDINEEVWGFSPFKSLNGSKTCIGNFPLAKKILPDIKIIEREPQEDQFNPKQGEKIIAKTDYLIITAQTLMNGTLPRILFLAQGANITLLGPTAPLSEIWKKYGINTVCGVRPTDNQKMLEFISQAGTMLILDDRAEKVTIEF